MTRIRSTPLQIRAHKRKRVHATSAMMALALLAGLAGCAASPALFLPDGRPTTQIQCNPADPDACAAQARARCNGDGFDVVSQTDQNNTRTLVFACQKR